MTTITNIFHARQLIKEKIQSLSDKAKDRGVMWKAAELADIRREIRRWGDIDKKLFTFALQEIDREVNEME